MVQDLTRPPLRTSAHPVRELINSELVLLSPPPSNSGISRPNRHAGHQEFVPTSSHPLSILLQAHGIILHECVAGSFTHERERPPYQGESSIATQFLPFIIRCIANQTGGTYLLKEDCDGSSSQGQERYSTRNSPSSHSTSTSAVTSQLDGNISISQPSPVSSTDSPTRRLLHEGKGGVRRFGRAQDGNRGKGRGGYQRQGERNRLNPRQRRVQRMF